MSLAAPETAATDYDVVVVGGGFAGASSALLLRRRLPAARILIVEREDQIGYKVGEATVEVSGFFLERVLGLAEHLAEHHLPKHGLRYWFADRSDRTLREMTEIGPRSAPDLPSYQLDRSRLDRHLLDRAVAEGVEVAHPAKARSIEPGWPISRLVIEPSDGAEHAATWRDTTSREITTRWVIDASGRHAFIARRLRLLERTERHPIAASWGRWQGVADLDAPAEETGLPPVAARRVLATNHFCGDGWWCWVIPLACGKTSIGWVYNKEMVDPAADDGDSRRCANERYLEFVRSQPGLRELVANAEPCAGDLHSLRHLSYRCSRYADRGWALVADAASFLDPYYSPGLDHAAISISATVAMIGDELEGQLSLAQLDGRIETHNRSFVLSYERWLDALYTGKYRLLGDAELTTCAFLIDTALYYLGVLTPISRHPETLENPIFGVDLPQATFAYRFARSINLRLQRLSTLRRRSGHFARRNAGWRLQFEPLRLGRGALPALFRGLSLWAKMEIQQVFWTLLPRAGTGAARSRVPGIGQP